MEFVRSVNIKSRCALVVYLVDTYTGKAPIGKNLSVTIVGLFQKPIRKADGAFIFTDLPEGTYTIRFQSVCYLEERHQVSVTESDPIVYLPLVPNPAYPFGEGATLMRATIKSANGSPVEGASVTATVVSEDCVRAKLAQDEALKGTNELSFMQTAGSIPPGSTYLLKDVKDKSKEASEVCTIASVSQNARSYVLLRPLQFTYRRGAMLVPVIQTRSDSRGEIVLCFPAFRTKSFEVNLNIALESASTSIETRLEDGKFTNLGTIQFT